MSSGKVRKEKKCLNCGHEVEHLFCSKCGQKNVEIKENFWHLALHYITDYFHFDSKLLHSIKPLIIKPGFLPKEYMEGRRAKYINPIGSLIFLSTIFFIIFLSIGNSKRMEISPKNVHITNSKQEEIKLDSISTQLNDSIKVNIGNKKLNKKIADKFKQLISEGHESEREVFVEKFKHNFPKVMVLLIPFLAFFLWLFYIRKKMLYVEHLIFVIYTHCFIYLFLIFSVLISLLWPAAFGWSFLIIILYIIASMKNFYEQGLFKTIIKFLMISICYSFLLLIGIIANAIIAAL